jgi:hypothetical protein
VTLTSVVGTWGAPPDLPAKVAIALAAAAVGLAFVRKSPVLHDGTERRFLGIASVAAGVLSIAYISSYLHGGPRIIDATTYFLQGRALSHGDFSWTPLAPTAEFRGRFLIYNEETHTLGGIFPPGYPLLLAFGFALGAPMIVGPALAAGLVVATYRLARALDLGVPEARAAALLSITCAALRYHTADTMSHGATALGVTLALECGLRRRAALAWLAVGYVFATRPISAIPIGLVVGALVWRCERRALVGLVPGILLLLLSQRAVTGSFFASAQRMYYALSDGPSGCFRYGFGTGTGCVFEHGDFVHARLENGYGLVEALGTTVRRLHHHLLDVANFELLAPLVLVPVMKKRARAASAVVGLQLVAYLPFYFDGDYPGGGARFFADVLPIEHVLVVLAVTLVTKHVERTLYLVLAVSLAGFAVHASFEHGKLRDRDGGHPWFEKEVLTHASITQGLVFIDSDHGFALAHDPEQRIETGVIVARRRGDDRDRMLYENLGRPPTFWYRFEPDAKIKDPLTVPWAPPEHGDVLRFEAEAEWPALGQSKGFAAPGWTYGCASGQRALVLTPDDEDVPASAEIELPVPSTGDWELTVAVANARIPNTKAAKFRPLSGALTVLNGTPGDRFAWDNPKDCASLPPLPVHLTAPATRVRLEAFGGPVAVDALYLRSVRTP